MWKRERVERVELEDVLASAPVQPPPVAPPVATPSPAAAATPQAPRPAAPARPAPKGSILGASLRFKGELVADEDLVVEGQVEGSILHTRSITIGTQGRMRGDIRARRVIIEGTVDGNLYALESVTLRAGATVRGDVFAARVAVEDGARLSGRIDMDNAPTVPKVDVHAGGSAEAGELELSAQEVGELLSKT